jgi:hypothetical protein
LLTHVVIIYITDDYGNYRKSEMATDKPEVCKSTHIRISEMVVCKQEVRRIAIGDIIIM